MSAEIRVQAAATLRNTCRHGVAPLRVCWRRTGALLAGCSGNSQYLSSTPPPEAPQPPPGATIGTGRSRPALILPLSAPGNAGVAGQAMRNAAEMALAEFNAPNIQLLVKDDAGTPEAARQGAQQALDEGAEIILGPLFAQSVSFVGQVARPRNVPVIAFSTDTNVASSGVYLLSFLPESDVERTVQYAASIGKHAYRRFDSRTIPTARSSRLRSSRRWRGAMARSSALERYPHDKSGMGTPIHNIAQASARADALFIPDGGDAVPDVVADAGGGWGQYQAAAVARHRTVGRSADLCARRRSKAACSRPPMPPDIEISWRATGPDTSRTRCGPRPWPMTRWR